MLNALSESVNAFSSTVAKLSYMRDFKSFMRTARLRAGFASQQAAAEAIGCDRGTVGMWEAPSSAVTKVSSEYLLAVAKAYRVRPESLNGEGQEDGFPWSPPDDAAPSQLRRYDMEILASAIKNAGASGMVQEDALFSEYERLRRLKASVLTASPTAGDGKSELEQRRNKRAGEDPKRKSR